MEVGSHGELTVRNVSYDDTGSYTCAAHTGAGTDNLTHTVTVSGQPGCGCGWVWVCLRLSDL